MVRFPPRFSIDRRLRAPTDSSRLETPLSDIYLDGLISFGHPSCLFAPRELVPLACCLSGSETKQMIFSLARHSGWAFAFPKYASVE